MKVLIVDDHPLVRRGLVSTLSFEDNIEQIEEAANVNDALSILSSKQPEISIVDLQLATEDGLEIVSRAKKADSRTKFIILTSSSRKDDFMRAREIGVDGYLLKEAFAEDIIYALHVVERGRKFFHPEILQNSMDNSYDNTLEQLTPREKDVLVELGKGLSNMQIADNLFISEHTVKKHISSILAKLNLSHRTEAALYANNLIKIGQT